MKITHVEIWPVPIQLGEPYTIGYGTFDRVTPIFVQLVSDRKIVGYGSGAPDVEVTGETSETVLSSLKDVAAPLLHGRDPLRAECLMTELRRELHAQPTALAAVEMALYDILGKVAGLPLWRLWGGYRESFPISVTIGILPALETVEKARHWTAKGFTRLKIKGGHQVEQDIERLHRVREAVGSAVGICFDANQAFSVADTVRLAQATRDVGLEFIEQPTPKKDRLALQEITRATGLAVMADEALLTAEDGLELIQDRSVALFNLKLMKVGGVGVAARIAALAQAGNIQSMVGCMDESELSIAAGLHFALSQPNVIYADLDGHLGMVGDPCAGSLELRDGVLFPPEGPGIGVEPKN